MDIILQSALIVAVALVVLLAILVVNDMTNFTCNVVSGASWVLPPCSSWWPCCPVSM